MVYWPHTNFGVAFPLFIVNESLIKPLNFFSAHLICPCPMPFMSIPVHMRTSCFGPCPKVKDRNRKILHCADVT
jgi:hypothetical protein